MSFTTRFVSCSAMAGLLLSGCATATQSDTPRRKPSKRGKSMQVQQPFPSKARIEEISEGTVQQPLARVGTLAAVTSWSIDPAVPNADWTQPYAGDDPNASAYAAWVEAKAPKVTTSASVTCVAQQYARFQAEHAKELAGADVMAFMHARCGVPARVVPNWSWTFPKSGFKGLNPNQPEPKVMEVLQGASKKALTGLGVWATDTHVHISVALIEPELSLDPTPFASGSNGGVVVSGIYPKRTEWMQAFVTHGSLGAKDCARVRVEGPKGSFAFRCPTNPQDARAVIEVAAAPRGSLLGQVVARRLVSPNGTAPTSYEAPALSVPASEGDFSSSAVLAGINALRGQAGLGDVVGAPEQDSVSANLFPHLMAGSDQGVRDEASLGLIAGWQVGATIRQGTFETMFTHADTPLDRALAGALFSPGFRSVALGRDTRVLSNAVVDSPETNTRGLLSVAYEVFEPSDFTSEETAVFDALDDARAKVGLPPVTRVEGGNDETALAASAERIRTGESTPREELDRMVSHFRDTVGRNFYGVIYSPTRIDGWSPEFDDEFFKHENIAVATTVSYFVPPGAAWGQHVVFMVFTPL